MFKKSFRKFDEVAQFLREERFQLYTLIVNKITDCMITGKTTTLVAEFLITDEGVTFKIEMKKEEWYESLHLALNYFEETEEYEKCSEIKKLIKDLYE